MNDLPELWYKDVYDNDKYADLRLKIYADLLSPYLRESSKILDIGCYTARLLDFLPKDKHIEYWGVDFDEKALEIAKQKGANVKFIKFDTEPILFDYKFDIIVAGEVLEHLINPAKILEQMQQLIKPDGIVLISLPNECTIYHRVMCLFGKGVDSLAFKLYKHLHLPTIKQSEGFVRKYFNIITRAYYVNPGGQGSRWELFGKLTQIVPITVWLWLANVFPGLFARGAIFICIQYAKNE
jgi:SAM-dependent methyltransferase